MGCGLNLRAQIVQANYQFYPQLFDTISSQAKDLITRLLKASPDERISADEILKHPWLQDSQIIRRANALMATQLRGKKRVVEEVEVEVEDMPEKRSKVGESVSVFRTPQIASGGIFN